jgi:protein-L-isoaspartate(D-aspartate) O-methyltransferase
MAYLFIMMTLEDCRQFYAEEIKFAASLQSPRLVEAFAHVPRERFLGPGPWEVVSPDVRALAASGIGPNSYALVDDPRHVYHNVVVALDKAADINNGQPSALARWVEALDLAEGNRVYHLGCGVGYYTAIMAEVVGPSGSVVGIEVHPDLAARAAQNLSGYANVGVREGDGAKLDPGSCDAMLINAGVTHPLSLWLDRLSDGGRLVVPLTMNTTPTLGVGLMMKIVRQGERFSAQVVSSLAIYSCKNARDEQREPLLKKALTTGALTRIKSVRRDSHEQSDMCIVHGTDVCLSSVKAV